MSDQQPEPVEAQKSDKKSIPWVTIGIVSAVLVICISSFAKGSGEPEDLTYQAEGHCEDWVKEKLKAPASADFTTTSTVGAGQGPWTFAGTVDADNSFGAKIRNKWECRIELGDGMFTGSTRLLD